MEVEYLIKDNKLTTKNVNLAKKVYNPNARSLRKSAWLKLVPIADSIIKILGELLNANEELKLSTDRLLLNSLNFITTIACDWL